MMAKTRLSVSINDEVMAHITAAQQRYVNEGRKVTRILKVKPASEVLVEAALRGFTLNEPVEDMSDQLELVQDATIQALEQTAKELLQGKEDALAELRSYLYRRDDDEGAELVQHAVEDGRTMADLVRDHRILEDRLQEAQDAYYNATLVIGEGHADDADRHKQAKELGEWATPDRAVQVLGELRTLLGQQKPGWVDGWIRKQHPDWFEG